MSWLHNASDAAARFERLSLRERVLVSAAVLAGVVIGWTVIFQEAASAKERTLAEQVRAAQESIVTLTQSIQDVANGGDRGAALAKEEALKRQLADANDQLVSKSAGLIPPERMVQVIHDVLSRQRGVTLISLHNKPVTTLAPASDEEGASNSTGPYVHPVELVVEGRYLDVLAYLRALEALEWRFYWRLLELKTTEHPINRFRVELSTLSLDKDWIGV